jgi:hypothetical protein
MHSFRTFLTIGVLAACAGAARAACEAPLLRVDGSGAVVAGSKQSLLAHVNRGGTVRVGWQLDWNIDGHIDIAHWASASVLSVFEGEVFARFEDLTRPVPVPGQTTIGMVGAAQPAQWSGIVSSSGVLQSASDDGEVQQWSVASEWCVGSAHTDEEPACVATWTEQFRNDQDGSTERGTREALLSSLRRGDSLRVAWGATFSDGDYSVEHVAEPVFFSIVGGEHVVVQLPEHIGQNTYARLDGSNFNDQPQVMWRGLLRTDGLFDAVWVDRASGQIVRRLPQRAAVSWITFSPPEKCDLRAPLQLAVPGGVTPDTARAAERIPK